MQDYNVGILYNESQYFRQLWLWILLLGIAAISIWSIVQQLIFGKDFGNNPAPDAVLIVAAIVFGFGFPVIFYKMNLTTQVRNDGIYYRFFPFHLSFHKIELGDISECEVQNYSALKDYGGGVSGMEGRVRPIMYPAIVVYNSPFQRETNCSLARRNRKNSPQLSGWLWVKPEFMHGSGIKPRYRITLCNPGFR